MEYRNYGETCYIRMDRGDEIIRTILDVCRREKIRSATYSGIGGCESAEIQTCDPDLGVFELQRIQGRLELASLNGNVAIDQNGEYTHHTHAVFSYREDGNHRLAAGHIRSTTVLYTAEIELRPVVGGGFVRAYDPENRTRYWEFSD